MIARLVLPTFLLTAKATAPTGSLVGISMGRAMRCLAAFLLVARSGLGAAAAERPVLVELFTSQGCSSCPPAEHVLLDLDASRPDVLALAFHVDYWDRLGWKDPFSSKAATDRQRAYQDVIGSDQVYTPQAVVDGRIDVLGSDATALDAALSRASEARRPAVPITIGRKGGSFRIELGAGSGRARVLLIGFDRRRETPVRRGENAGRTIVQANVVRSVTDLGDWTGRDTAFELPVPAGERVAVLLQAANGEVLGAARSGRSDVTE